MFKKVALVLGIVVAALLVVIATRPDEFKVERSATIAAPVIVAFSQVNDFHAWASWSPWEKLDPNMKRVHEGSPSGQGAVYSWTGNDQVGAGRMTITDSKPGERVVIKLEFLKPFEATNTTIFTFTPQGDSTKVTWTMEGKNNFLTKAFTLVNDMDKMIGNDFDKGLAQMKVVTEGEAQKQAAAAAAIKAAEEAAAAAKAAEVAAAAAPPVEAPAEAPAAGVSH